MNLSDLPAPRPVDDLAADSVEWGSVEWREITRIVSTSLPDHDPEIWLGELLLEVQKASDRAIASARAEAESIVARAQAEVDDIRERGRHRAEVLSRVHAIAHRASSDAAPAARPTLDVPSPPRAMSTAPAADPSSSAFTPVATPQDPRLRPSPTGRRATATAPADGTGPSALVAVPFQPIRLALGPDRRSTTAGAATTPAASGTTPPPPLSPPPLPTTSPVRAPAPVEVLVERPSTIRRLSFDRPSLLLVVGILAMCLGFVAFTHYWTPRVEHQAQDQLTKSFAHLAATRDAPSAGGVMGLLNVADLSAQNLAVVEGATPEALRKGPAYDSSSQLPGQPGAVVIVAHRRWYGAPFARLSRLRIGDVVSLRTTAGLYVFRVSRNPQVLQSGHSTLQLPSAAEVRASGGNPQQAGQALVMATSVGSNSSQLEVVVATLDQSNAATVAPPPLNGTVTAVLRAVPGQRVGLLWAVFWVLALIAAFRLASRWRPNVAAGVLYPIASVVAVLVTYQLYLALARLIPGTN